MPVQKYTSRKTVTKFSKYRPKPQKGRTGHVSKKIREAVKIFKIG